MINPVYPSSPALRGHSPALSLSQRTFSPRHWSASAPFLELSRVSLAEGKQVTWIQPAASISGCHSPAENPASSCPLARPWVPPGHWALPSPGVALSFLPFPSVSEQPGCSFLGFSRVSPASQSSALPLLNVNPFDVIKK